MKFLTDPSTIWQEHNGGKIMSRSLWIAATGMMAQQMSIDVISNNLSNTNTSGFKKQRINFQDLMYQTDKFGGSFSTSETQAPSGLQIGLGTKPVSTQKIFTQGQYQNTDNPLDLVIRGDGFFKVIGPNGETMYTRNGAFSTNADGNLVTTDGMLVDPQITIPANATKISFGADGTVSVIAAGESTPSIIGQLNTVRFINPAGLENYGNNLYTETAVSGTPMEGTPGSDGLGALDQGFLEGSNVETAEEMIKMIIAQRAYEVNSKSIQTTDNMLGIANNLKG